ncbi:MAG: CopG family ribbon-helix-helix protein [Candidatus Binatia bacterium]
MARFMVSMSDDMLEKLDRQARMEHRSRSELLREAVRRHLANSPPPDRQPMAKTGKQRSRGSKKWTKTALEQALVESGSARRGCPGLDSLVGPIKGPVDMKRVLRITKKLTGVSRQIIEDREDRL